MADWERGRPCSCLQYYTVTSPLTPAFLNDAGMNTGSASAVAESRKHVSNGPKYPELGWVCIPLAIETFAHLASQLAVCASMPKGKVSADLYGRLSLMLTQYVASAILAKSLPQPFDLVFKKKKVVLLYYCIIIYAARIKITHYY